MTTKSQVRATLGRNDELGSSTEKFSVVYWS